MKTICRIALVAALLIPALPAADWNETGHRAIALLAYDPHADTLLYGTTRGADGLGPWARSRGRSSCCRPGAELINPRNGNSESHFYSETSIQINQYGDRTLAQE
jgi:hypothetical protein